jgi:hypothetical protein
MIKVTVSLGALTAGHEPRQSSATLNDGSAKKYLDGGDEIEL